MIKILYCNNVKHDVCSHWNIAFLQGLLQNEAFGGADDKVGFFGRCMLHGMVIEAACKEAWEEENVFQCKIDDHISTCARTEVISLPI